MKFSFKHQVRSLTAGALAALIVTASLTGCQYRTLIDTDTSSTQSQQVSSAASSQVASSQSAAASSQAEKAVSSAVSSAASSAAASSVSSAASKPVQKLQTAVPSSKAKTATAVTVKKIADDSSSVNSPRYNVINTTALASGYTHIDQRGGYNALPDITSRSLYSQIGQAVYKVTATPTLEGNYPTQRVTLSGIRLSEAQLRLALIAYLNDNPQVFWITNFYSYGYSNDGNDTFVQLYSYVPQSECNSMVQQVNNKVTAILKAMPQGLSEFDREMYLFDYIVKNNTYNDAAVTDTSLWKSFCAYGALIDGKIVCEGYSRAMQLLSSYAGLQCLLVTGQGSSQSHMWNIIKINENWYHLDITWCDQSTPIYNYFNVTDAVITQTHTVSPLASTLAESEIDGSASGTATQCNLVLPACTATDANYFKVKGIHISDLNGTDDKAAIATISSAVQQKKPSVSFYVSDGADYASIISGLVQGSPYKVASYLSQINQSGTTNKLNISGVKFLSDEADRGLTVFLSYK